MQLWKLTPIKPDSPHMLASWHKGHAIVRAPSEDDARRLVTRHLGIAVENGRHPNTLFSPWDQYEVVECIACSGADYSRDGESAVLYPLVDS